MNIKVLSSNAYEHELAFSNRIIRWLKCGIRCLLSIWYVVEHSICITLSNNYNRVSDASKRVIWTQQISPDWPI